MMYILKQDFLQKYLTMSTVIESLKKVLKLESQHPNYIQSPERLVLTTNQHHPSVAQGSHLSMPATIMLDDTEYTSIKLVTICPDNPKQNLPTTNAAIVLSENTTGKTLAFMEATFITQIRTAALSGIATELMASPQATSVAVIGCGGMAYEQLNAVLTVRPTIQTVYLWNRDAIKTQTFAQKFTQTYPDFAINFVHCATISEAVGKVDIINLATRAEQGLFSVNDIQKNIHINAVGAYLPSMKEVSNDVIAASSCVIVDDKPGCLVEAGDLIQAHDESDCIWQWSDLTGDLPDLVNGLIQPTIGEGISVFKSVGTAYFDAAVAIQAYQLARENKESKQTH